MTRKPATRRATKTKTTRRARARPADSKKPDALDTLIAASAEALTLPMNPDWHAGVRFNLNLIFTHAALVDEFPLPDDAEPAPVFHA